MVASLYGARRFMRRWLALCGVACLAGCGEDAIAGATPPDPPAPPGCDVGQLRLGDGCCAAGSMIIGAQCVPAGIAPEQCAEGFVHDGVDGCEHNLPACDPGQIAVPGASNCHALTDCGPAPWGDIPDEPNRQHVDAGYSGGGSDGTAVKPWTTVTDAIAAAAPGAIVAIAAGDYAEDVVIALKPLRLWGRCPELVSISGVAPTFGTVELRASGSELHALALTGPKIGAFVWGALDVLIDSVWVHDTGSRGIDVETAGSGASATIVNVLIERASVAGLFLATAGVALEDSAIRDTRAGAGGYGRGVYARQHDMLPIPSVVSIRGSLIETSRDVGVYANGSDVSIEGSVIRDTLALPGGLGSGINVNDSDDGSRRGDLRVSGSLIERSVGVGIFLRGSDGIVDTTVVRDTLADVVESAGRAIDIESSLLGQRPALTLTHSVLRHGQQTTLFVAGGDAVVEGSVIRDTALDGAGRLGLGVGARNDPVTGNRSSVTIRGSQLLRSHAAGILIQGSDLLLEASTVHDTAPDGAASYGWGIGLNPPPSGERSNAVLRDVVVEDSTAFGIAVFGSDADIATSRVSTSAPEASGTFGDGVSVIGLPAAAASLLLVGSRVEHSARAALSIFGAVAILHTTRLNCQPIDINGEELLGTPYTLDNAGGNVCGCGEEDAPCKLLSAGLSPPPPLDGP